MDPAGIQRFHGNMRLECALHFAQVNGKGPSQLHATLRSQQVVRNTEQAKQADGHPIQRQGDPGGYPVGHVGWVASLPDALHVAFGESVADGVDGIESERAKAVLVDTAERVLVQAANGIHSKSGKWRMAGIQRFHGRERRT
eukprot:2478967-Prymnesium_polylepis.1